MNNKKVWIGVGILIVVIAVVYGYAKNAPKSQTVNSFSLPVGMEDPAVTGIFISYNFMGEIKNLEAAADDISLVLDSETDDLPVFNITKNTKIYLVSGDITTPGKVSDLKSKTNVTIAAYYDLKTNQWVTTGLYLSVDKTK